MEQTQICKLNIAYLGYPTKIWRDVEVPEDYPLSKLGFLIIAIFDTRAQHIFHFNKGNQFYSLPIPGEDLLDGEIDVYKVKLSDLKMNQDVPLYFTYDYGCEQNFVIKYMGQKLMQKGQSSHYPVVTNGAGHGIIDDMAPEDFVIQVKMIEETGVPSYMYDGMEANPILWDYRDFDIKKINRRLHDQIERIQADYAI